MNSLISVIVPVYNVEKYLSRCIESIIAQTYDLLEIILVDDGSSDLSGKICDEYEKKDDRIVVYHKKNGGLSSARNYGIERANGLYLGFIDSDDYIEPDMFEVLLNNMREAQADLSICGVYDVYGSRKTTYSEESKKIVVGKEEAIEIVFKAEITSVMAVNKLYKRDAFERIRYPENRISEDAFVIVDILDNCERVVIDTSPKYYYIHRPNSITTQAFSIKTMDVIDAYERNYRLIQANYPRLLDVAQMRLCWAYFYVLDRLIFQDRDDTEIYRKRVISFLKRNTLFIIKNDTFHLTRKVSAILLNISPGLYKLCVMIKNKKEVNVVKGIGYSGRKQEM